MCSAMDALLVAVTCALLSCSVTGNDWWGEYHEGTRHYSDEELNEPSLNKTRPMSFKHPPFQCPDMNPSPTVPSSVELVKAADIKVIAALGDSMTTAISANSTNVKGVPQEHRGVSWSIGGYGTFQDVITLANIIKLFNPTVLGASHAKTYPSSKEPDFNETGFNLAVTGHNSDKLPLQARKLIDALKKHKDVDFKDDWKLLTILIGMNDICDYCKDKKLYSADNFVRYVALALEMLKKEVPRMIVNVVQIMQMHFLKEVKQPSPGCELQRHFCSCLVIPETNSPEFKEVVEVNREFQRKLEKLLHTNRFFKKDFAVVLQPYLELAAPPRLPNGKIDMTFFSHDCFHITIKGHEELAKALWNNMFQPAGEKMMVKSFNEPITLICPPEKHPYIYTHPISKSSPSLLRSRSTSPAAVILLLLLYVA